MSEFAHPANIVVMLDEHPDSINDGIFVNDPNWATAANWSELPASHHGGGANLSFADGHTEIHYWKSGTTKVPVIYTSQRPLITDAQARADFQWLAERAGVLYPNY
jgi:prepilin-type processing-associated H-X9-DG protein